MVRSRRRAGGRKGRPVVYLHIGTPKSGTTYLQNTMWLNCDVLRSAGVLYPGETRRAHFLAAIDLQRIDFRGHHDPESEDAWESLVEEAREWTGTVVISHEVFCAAPQERARAALADLDFAEVHLVLTVRDIARQIPAAWQEDLKNRYSMGLTEYIDAVRDRADVEQATGFWRMQDAGGILRRWAADLPPGRVHLVTVPPPGSPPDLLWERFASVIGIDPELCDRTSVRTNPSLGTVEAALLRRFNEHLKSRDIDWPTYESFVKFHLAERGLAGRSGKQAILLPASEYAWVSAWSRELVRELAERRYTVVGDLAELIPGEPGTLRLHPGDVGADAMLEASFDGIASVLDELAERTAINSELREELEQTHKALAAAYERPVWRQVLHRVARWVPPLRPVLRLAARLRDGRPSREPGQAVGAEHGEAAYIAEAVHRAESAERAEAGRGTR